MLQAGGVVIRYGQLYGPGTYYETAPPEPPRVHVDDAARQTVPAVGVPGWDNDRRRRQGGQLSEFCRFS